MGELLVLCDSIVTKLIIKLGLCMYSTSTVVVLKTHCIFCTLFKPRRKSALETFLQTKRKDTQAHDDHGEHVGKKVVAKYRGNWVAGVVKEVQLIEGKQR